MTRWSLAPLVLSALVASAARAGQAVPALSGPVVDLAGMLSPGEAQRLAQLSSAARAENGGQGVQLQYLLVPSLSGEDI